MDRDAFGDGGIESFRETTQLMPSQAHLIKEDGTTEDVQLSELKPKDRVLVKPGEKIPTGPPSGLPLLLYP